MIMAGLVLVDGERMDKSGALVSEDAEITVKGKDHPYVSRGGVKLEHALGRFGVDPSSMICVDLGASTGGFTDCLLKHGARKVWAIDVGTNQLDYRLRNDERVVSMEGVNAREMDISVITDPVDLLVADVSFISLRLAVPPLLSALKEDASLVLLVKPQFEAGREQVGKHGVVKDKAVHRDVMESLASFFCDLGLFCLGWCESPILGRKGNIEYFIYLKRNIGEKERISKFDIDNTP